MKTKKKGKKKGGSKKVTMDMKSMKHMMPGMPKM